MFSYSSTQSMCVCPHTRTCLAVSVYLCNFCGMDTYVCPHLLPTLNYPQAANMPYSSFSTESVLSLRAVPWGCDFHAVHCHPCAANTWVNQCGSAFSRAQRVCPRPSRWRGGKGTAFSGCCLTQAQVVPSVFMEQEESGQV